MRRTLRALAVGLAVGVGAATVVAVSAAQPSAPARPTAEQFLSPAYPSELVSAAKADRLAWISYDQGLRNVYRAAPPDYRPVRLTRFLEDTGTDLSNLQISGDGSVVVFVHGHTPNREGWIANPTSDPDGAERAVWAARTAGGPAWRLAEGTTPELSPDGRFVLFARDDQIYRLRVSQAAAATAIDKAEKPLIKAWGANGNPRWSPDGTRIAFVSDRVDHSLIGIYDVRARSVHFLSPSVDRDTSPTWSPDGRRVAFIRRPGLPYGQQAQAGSGGIGNPPGPAYRPGEPQRGSRFGAFTGAPGGQRGQQPDGPPPIPGLTVSAFTSAIETYPAPLASGASVAVLSADARRPQSVGLVPVGGGEARIIYPTLPKDFPLAEHVVPENVTLKAPDGLEIHNQLFLPRDLKPGERRPAIIFVHGGPIRQMLLGYHYMHFYHWAYGINHWLASQGYVVLSVNYRSGIGYGKAFRLAPNTAARGNSEYQDVLTAGKYLQTRPDVDPSRVGIWGLSYGGLLTAQALARNSDLFVAGVDLAGVHLYGNSLDPENLAYKSSAASQIDTWKSPVLLVQGDDDRNVAFTQTTGLVQLLRAHNVYHELIVFPDDVHESLLHRRWIYTLDRMEAFLDRFLRKAPAAGLAGGR